MTNYEYYKEKIEKITNDRDTVAFMFGEPIPCSGIDCDFCERYDENNVCSDMILLEWANKTWKPKLNADERKFCELFKTGWLVRDKDGELKWCKSIPIKDGDIWINVNPDRKMHLGLDENRILPDVKFDFIKWEDEFPYEVESLLKSEYGEE